MKIVNSLALLMMWVSPPLAAAEGAFHAENNPHQPNVLGKNICYGLDVSALPPEWRTPMLIDSSGLGSQKATHRVVFDAGSELVLSEELADKQTCSNVLTNQPRWKKNYQTQFCLKSWGEGKFVNISLEVKSTSEANMRNIASTLYAIGACQIGDVSPEKRQGLFYGEIMKADSTPVRLPN